MGNKPDKERIVITGIGLTSPIGNNLDEYRANILAGKSGVKDYDIRYVGKTHAGICEFDELKYQKRKELRRGTRAGSIAVYCTNEAVVDSKLDFENVDKSRVGIFLGVTEHGNVETEHEIYNISKFDHDIKYWSHHHNPRTVANNPAGEVTLNMKITGPHYCIGGACAAGNLGLVQGVQMLLLDEVDVALSGGISESIRTFGIFAAFKSQNALAFHEDSAKASRPFDNGRNGIVIAEGGAVYCLERLSDAKARGAEIYGEIVGHATNSDAKDFVLPYYPRQAECMKKAVEKAGLKPSDIDIISTHATATPSGDVEECAAIREVFEGCDTTYINNTKSFIGHAMGAAGALELAGNIPSFKDNLIHHTINVDDLDERCVLKNLVIGEPKKVNNVKYILNNSFGMLGINCGVIVKKFES